MGALLPFLILVPCLLMIVMMMRGHGHGHGHGKQEKPAAAATTAELRTRREELDRLIDDRERDGDNPL